MTYYEFRAFSPVAQSQGKSEKLRIEVGRVTASSRLFPLFLQFRCSGWLSALRPCDWLSFATAFNFPALATAAIF